MTKLIELKPTRVELVRNIAGKFGIKVKSEYDWCFSAGPDGPHLVNIWHDDMREADGEIYFIDDSANWSDRNRATAVTAQINRASKVTSVIQTAYFNKAPLNVAILSGKRKQGVKRETSEADFRELDSVAWYPHRREADGRIRVVRGKPQADDFDPNEEIDDLSKQKATPIPEPAPKVPRAGTATYARDSEVVRLVKERAADGCCELCGEQGFETPNGGFYLEAHHVIPISCRGRDDVRNVVALCAEDHRKAHFGADRADIRDRLIWDVLAPKYPNDSDFFEHLDEMSKEMNRSDAFLRNIEERHLVGD